MCEKEKQIQIKESTFVKMFHLSIKLTDFLELQNEVFLDDETFNDLLIIKNDLSEKMNAKNAREEYTKKLMEKK